MQDFKEIGKGIMFFLLGNLFFYFGWTMFNGMLTTLTSASGYLGALGWFTFFTVYALTVPIYSIYAVISGSSGRTTNGLDIAKAIGVWFFGMILILILYYIFFLPNAGLIDTLTGNLISWEINGQSGNNQETIDVINGIGSLAVVIVMLLSAGIPYYYVVKGYGLLENKET